MLAFASRMRHIVVVALFQVKVDLFDDELALLVLLAHLVRLDVSPSHHILTPFAEDVGY